MNCKEFQEYISAFVDDKIDEVKKEEARLHLNSCPSCYFDYKIESMVKKILSLRYFKVACPDVLKNQIIINIIAQRSTYEILLSYLRYLFNKKLIRIAFALSITTLFFIFYFKSFENNKENYYTKTATIIYQNCKELKKHNFPEKTVLSSNSSVIKNFISANGIPNPKMPKTDWIVLAAGIESYQGYNAAHLLFKSEEDTVYMMECEVDKLKYSHYWDFFDKIKNELKKEKFVKVNYKGCSIFLRIEDNIFMAFAMNSNNLHASEELIASLE